jgi:hypothetical protein
MDSYLEAFRLLGFSVTGNFESVEDLDLSNMKSHIKWCFYALCQAQNDLLNMGAEIGKYSRIYPLIF